MWSEDPEKCLTLDLSADEHLGSSTLPSSLAVGDKNKGFEGGWRSQYVTACCFSWWSQLLCCGWCIDSSSSTRKIQAALATQVLHLQLAETCRFLAQNSQLLPVLGPLWTFWLYQPLQSLKWVCLYFPSIFSQLKMASKYFVTFSSLVRIWSGSLWK